MFNSWKSTNDFTQRSRIKGKQNGTQHRTPWYTTLESDSQGCTCKHTIFGIFSSPLDGCILSGGEVC